MPKDYDKIYPQRKDFADLFGPGSVPGLLTEDDMAIAIPAISNLLPDHGIFVEIGCFLGKSSVEWANQFKQLNKDYKILSIDSFNTPPEIIVDLLMDAEFDIPDGCVTQLDYFKHYTNQFDFVYPIEGFFNEKFEFVDPIAGVFEDSSHTLSYLSHALPFWYDRLESKGILSGHDYNLEVKTAVDIFAAVRGLRVNTFANTNSSIWYIIKN